MSLRCGRTCELARVSVDKIVSAPAEATAPPEIVADYRSLHTRPFKRALSDILAGAETSSELK